MKLNIRGNKIEVTNSIKKYAKEKITRLDKYFDNSESLEVNALIKVKGKDQSIEITVPTPKFTLRAEETNADLYAAIDLVLDKLERQIRKNKTKLKNQNMSNNKFKQFNFEYEDTNVEEEETNKIVKRKTISTKPMDEEEAILEMELLGHNFFVYKDMNTNSINVVYKRKDGNYGIIETD